MMETFIKNISAHVLQNEMPYLFTVSAVGIFLWRQKPAELCVQCEVLQRRGSVLQHPCHSPACNSDYKPQPTSSIAQPSFFLPQLLASQPASITPLQAWSVGGNKGFSCSGGAQVKWMPLDFTSSWVLAHLDSIPHWGMAKIHTC